MRVLGVAALIMALAGCQSVDLTPKSAYPVAAKEFSYKGVAFKAGDHVKSIGRAGTFKPKDTGAEKEVNLVAGKTGIVLGGVERDASTQLYKGEPIQVALVRWDAQTWDRGTETVELGEFEATVHVEYLEVVKK